MTTQPGFNQPLAPVVPAAVVDGVDDDRDHGLVGDRDRRDGILDNDLRDDDRDLRDGDVRDGNVVDEDEAHEGKANIAVSPDLLHERKGVSHDDSHLDTGIGTDRVGHDRDVTETVVTERVVDDRRDHLSGDGIVGEGITTEHRSTGGASAVERP